MKHLFRDATSSVVRPRVTPDDEQALALARKFEALNYRPLNGFHKDRRQDRQPPRAVGRWASGARAATS